MATKTNTGIHTENFKLPDGSSVTIKKQLPSNYRPFNMSELPYGIPDSPLAANPDTAQPMIEDGMIAAPVPKEMRGQYGNFFLTNKAENKPMLENPMNVNPDYTEQLKPSEPIVQSPIQEGDKTAEKRAYIEFLLKKRVDPAKIKAEVELRYPEAKKYEPTTQAEALEFEKKKAGFKEKDITTQMADREFIKQMPKAKQVAMDSNEALGKMAKMKALLDSGVGGSGARAKAWAAPILDMLGKNSKGLDDASLYDSLSQAIAGSLRMQTVGGGQITEYEQKLLQKVSGGGRMAPEAAKELVDYYMKQGMTRIEEYNAMADDFDEIVPKRKGTYRKINPQTEKAEATIPQGAVLIPNKQTKDGKPAYRLPDGTVWTE